uniref:Ribosome-binding factor A n=1 Tax=Rhizophora mucronata TaxID=61149 RepID=A0A2P2L0V1_RHIMU
MLHAHLHHLRQQYPLFTLHRSSPPITAVCSTIANPIRFVKRTVPIHLFRTSSRPSLTTIRCMANPRRVKMVAKQIQRELSDMLLTDKILQYAVLPEAALGADRYLSSLTTISDVEVSGDLQVVKVYVSVFGDERGREVAIAGLKSKARYVRSELGKRMKLRLTPEIRFIEDEAMEKGSRVIAILDKIKADKRTPEVQEDEQFESSGSPEDDRDRDRDGDDPDEDIIYVN